MKKVLVVGLKNYKNIGDQLLVKSTEDICKSLGYETISVDFKANKRRNPIRYLFYGLIIKSAKLFKGLTLEYKLKNFAWNVRNGKHIRKNLKDVGAVIIACGNLMYSGHTINCMYETVIKEAKKKNIPVMLSAMSVEKANEQDYRFRRLKKFVCYENVTFFTTRDGETGLEKFRQYKCNNIETAYVADVAYCVSQYKNKIETGSVGVNIINGQIVSNYSEKISSEDLKKYYFDLFKLLDENNINYKVFTTGMNEDEAYAKEILKEISINGTKVEQPKTIDELYDIILSCDKIFGARMHSCILAHAAHIPVVGIIWDDKVRNFAINSGQSFNFLTKDQLNAKKAYELLMLDQMSTVDYTLTNPLKEKTIESIKQFLARNIK